MKDKTIGWLFGGALLTILVIVGAFTNWYGFAASTAQLGGGSGSTAVVQTSSSCPDTGYTVYNSRVKNSANTTGAEYLAQTLYIYTKTNGVLTYYGSTATATTGSFNATNVPCGKMIVVKGVGDTTGGSAIEDEFLATGVSVERVYEAADIATLQIRAYNSVYGALYVNTSATSSNSAYVAEGEPTYIQGTLQHDTFNVTTSEEMFVRYWLQAAQTDGLYGDTGKTGATYMLVAYDNTKWDDATLSVTQNGKVLTATTDVPSYADLVSKYSESGKKIYKMDAIGGTVNDVVVRVTPKAGVDPAAADNIQTDIVSTTNYLSADGVTVKNGIVKDDTSYTVALEVQDITIDIN